MPVQLVNPKRQVSDARATLLSLVTFNDFARNVYGNTLWAAVDALEAIEEHMYDGPNSSEGAR